MLKLIESGDAIAFVGAGLSRPLYPAWSEFLTALVTQAVAITGVDFKPSPGLTMEDPLNYAEEIKQHCIKHGTVDSYYALLGRNFGTVSERCTEKQRRLVRLPFRGIVTTNYDRSLEDALLDIGVNFANCCVVVKRDNDHHTVCDFLMSLNHGDSHFRVAHLHGVHDQTSEIILTRSDYEKAYLTPRTDRESDRLDDWPLHRKLVWALLATRRLIFFGTSLDDPVLKGVLEAVSRDLWMEGQAIHYLVLPLETNVVSRIEDQRKRLLRYGVQPVYYENRDKTYASFDQLIGEALERCGKQDPIGWLEEVNRDTETSLKPRED